MYHEYMKYVIFLTTIALTTVAYSQQPEFIPVPISSYGNILGYHYSQSQWYYRYIIENEYSYSDFSKSSDDSLKAIIDTKPKIDNTKSILDVYRYNYNKTQISR